MRLQTFLAILIAQGCSAQDDSMISPNCLLNFQEKVLTKISTLTEEVTVLKNQDIDKEGRIQAMETKLLIFEQAADHKDGIIENLLNQVDNLQIQINETNIEIGQQVDILQNQINETNIETSQQVDILQNQINETNIEISQHANQFESNEEEFQGTNINIK